MHIEFYKYQGTGNDFVMIDNRSNFFQNKIPNSLHTYATGVLGLVAMDLFYWKTTHIASNLETATDFKMVYYNSDGNQSSMCGNGGRCLVAFAKSYS
jgi:diaminopimelate epimerase